jgi:hypothetical protein
LDVTLSIAGVDLGRLAKRLVDARVVSEAEVQEHALPALLRRFAEALAEQLRGRNVQATWAGAFEGKAARQVAPEAAWGGGAIAIELAVPADKLLLRIEMIPGVAERSDTAAHAAVVSR